MEESTAREFKLLISGGVLMITGVELYQITGVVAAIGIIAIMVGILMFLGGFFEQKL